MTDSAIHRARKCFLRRLVSLQVFAALLASVPAISAAAPPATEEQAGLDQHLRSAARSSRAAPAASEVPRLPAIRFQRFELIDGFPFAEFQLVNESEVPFWFLALEGASPAYSIDVRTKRMTWQDATPPICGLTQYRRVELAANSSKSFLVDVPALSSVFRIGVPYYEVRDGPEKRVTSSPVTAPADLVRPSVPEPVVPPDEVVAPKALSRSAPPYPEIAMRASIEGTVVLRVVVGPSGAVDNVQVMKGEPVLATAAVAAVKLWRYSPTVWRGQPASVITTESIEFRLQNQE